jgi:hypothetical protein
VRDGVKDAREDRPPYFWAIFTHPGRWVRLKEGRRAVARVTVFGIIMDTTYQIMVFRAFRPQELVVIVMLLTFVPYLVWRGPVNRIARHWIQLKGAAVR